MSKKRTSSIVSGAGFAAAFWQTLDLAVRQRDGTDEDIYHIGTDGGSRLINQFADLIMGARLVTVREWQTWRKVTIGTHSGLAALAWEAQGTFQVKKGSHTQILLEYLAEKEPFAVASSSQELELIVVTVRGLDLCNPYSSYASICIRAQEFGLSLCPPEVALQLCLQHNWEPWLNYVLIGSELFRLNHGYPKYLFQLRKSKEESREIEFREISYDSNEFPGHTPFVFVRNK
ncbi:MAG: hypothetical protein KGH79_00110 [Patescibacteria group bacterium]|nr:hypothetical protein [Patescibacteria group bacterium]